VNRRLHRAAAPSLLLTFAALALAGCSANSATSPLNAVSNAQSNEAAVEVGMMVYAGTTPDVVPNSVVSGGTGSSGTIHGRGASPAAAETTVTNGNVTWNLSVRWFDASSNEQANYDPATTVRMQANSRGNGAVTGVNGSGTLHSAGTIDMMGVDQAATQVSTNATRNDTLSWTATGPSGSATGLTHSTGTLANVVEAKPVDQNYPSSGTGTWDLDVNRQLQGDAGSISEHFVAHVVVTFNGTHLVPLVVNGTHHFLLDLDTGAVTLVNA
jgi:hypothetical protein